MVLDYGTQIEELNYLIVEVRAGNFKAVGMRASITVTIFLSLKQLGKLQEPYSAKDDEDAEKRGVLGLLASVLETEWSKPSNI